MDMSREERSWYQLEKMKKKKKKGTQQKKIFADCGQTAFAGKKSSGFMANIKDSYRTCKLT